MKTYIALIPGILAAFYLYLQMMQRAKTPLAKTFLNIYVPTMLLLPQQYVAEIRLLHFNFCQFALVPIIIGYLFLPERRMSKTRLCFLDLAITSYILVCVISEFYNTEQGNPEQSFWGSVLYRNIFNVFLPYYFTRKFIYSNHLTAKLGQIIVLCLLISLMISSYEWRMVVNPYIEILNHFFPNQSEDPWFPTYRYNMVRISGPFGHPILFGMSLGLGLLYNHWLMKNGLWKTRFSFFPIHPYIKGFFLGLLLFIGLLLTISRGPLYGTLLAFFILGLGVTHRKWLYLSFLFIIFASISIITLQQTFEKGQIDRNVAATELESNTIYRANLFEAYSEYIQERPFAGWGSTTWPKAASMRSIDNQYIFILMTHGVVAFGLLCLILFITAIKLFWTGMKIPYAFKQNRSLNFTLLSILCMLSLTYLTVSMSGQIEVLTFMIIGLSQGFLDSRPRKQEYTHRCSTPGAFNVPQNAGLNSDEYYYEITRG